MPPALIIWIVEEVIKLAPAIKDELAILLKKDDPTPEDWARLKAMASKTYESYTQQPPPTAGSA